MHDMYDSKVDRRNYDYIEKCGMSNSGVENLLFDKDLIACACSPSWQGTLARAARPTPTVMIP
jgi:hypothetical protein